MERGEEDEGSISNTFKVYKGKNCAFTCCHF